MKIAHALVVVLLATVAGAHAAPPPLPDDAAHQSIGVVNCASSMCHGAVASWQDSNILHNEYSTWLRLDKHANAYNLLRNDDSKRIAKKLGLKKPAHEEKLCLDCHAHNPAHEKRGARFSITDGVSCEACHGPAGQWVQSHTEPEATHARNIQDGLYPASQPEPMARLCLSCHFGNEKKLVTHRLMGAGHPRLSFDLDTFANFLPPHYNIDKDWRARKGDYDGVRLWAIGQGVAVQQLLATLADPVRGRDGFFPELVLFDCHACHHPMSSKRWQPRLGIGPGKIRLNDSNLLMLRNIVKALYPSYAPGFSAQVQRLHKTIAGDADWEQQDALGEARKLAKMVDQQIRLFEQRRFSNADLKAILRALIDEGAADTYADYAGAEQAYMAIAGVASHLQNAGGFAPGAVPRINARLAAMRQLLRNDETYQPAAFKAELLALRQQIGPPARGEAP
jgi:hypothetical protein